MVYHINEEVTKFVYAPAQSQYLPVVDDKDALHPPKVGGIPSLGVLPLALRGTKQGQSMSSCTGYFLSHIKPK